MMVDQFKKFHPLVNFFYFALVLGLSMVVTHPVAQGISLLFAFLYGAQIEGRKAVLFSLKFSLPMLLIAALVNPMFSHGGVTILGYLPSGNPLTLESILYGLSSGIMFATVLLWFKNFNRVITSDKFIYLFGRIIPAMSLVLSMTLRFIPKFKHQMQTVIEAEKSLGRDISEGSLFKRMKNAVKVLSIMITWALENAIETADSMRSRGYGLKGRTAFSIYTFDDRDKASLAFLLFCAVFLISGYAVNGFSFRYFPSIRYAPFTPFTCSFFVVYFGLCSLPFFINAIEERKWKSLYSKM